MSAATKIGLGVASGYLLGRTKKLKLAITIGSLLAGQRVATSPGGLLKQGIELVDKSPELSKLRDELTGKLLEAAKSAAAPAATSRLELVSNSSRGGSRDLDEDPSEDEDQDPEEEPEDEEDLEAEPEDEEDLEEDEPEDEEDLEEDEPQGDEADDADDEPEPASRRCLLYTSPSPRDLSTSRMPSSA